MIGQRLLFISLRAGRKFSTEAAEIIEKSSDFALRAATRFPVANVGKRTLPFLDGYDPPKQAWVESFDTVEEVKLGIMDLHPAVFGAMPRIDLIRENVKWQQLYRFVSYAHTRVRSEMPGGGRKPWPQKGMGRARHGSIRSPLFKGGGISHGPRSPTPHFYMLPFAQRVMGLLSTLSIKLAQDDLHIVPNLDIPTEDPEFLEDVVRTRNWGISVLIVDVDDIMPRNITVASDAINHINLMPVYGLNVYSMLKHETLVLTMAAVEKIEERLLYQLHRSDAMCKEKKFKVNQV
ncbi:Ribosomal protein L4 [Nesidiocoris tenuis]|uniref:Large ribosomal subunit protein uL4m n=1 Tax=Nesidiocoris tenuis TaxID=355587 RepID=A0ABN7B885_9HEMI|nr:Ribosomal protein L4 [Nesidiocoris tenuis]